MNAPVYSYLLSANAANDEPPKLEILDVSGAQARIPFACLQYVGTVSL